MLDLLSIPGTYGRSDPAGREVRLEPDGEAAWQFRDGAWSSSGHWTIVKGSHLSIQVIFDDATARMRGDDVVREYFHLVDVNEKSLIVRTVNGREEKWVRHSPPRSAERVNRSRLLGWNRWFTGKAR